MPVQTLISGQHSCVGQLMHGVSEALPDGNPALLDKSAMLVYAGKFASMDGDVEITEPHIDKIINAYNDNLDKHVKLGKPESSYFAKMPPVQLDHSTSARDTVGRLCGKLSKGMFNNEDGVPVAALMASRVVFLGKENVERVMDGRWSNLSLGVDLETGKLNELTVTPFPAAPHASLLRAKRLNDVKTAAKGNYKGYPYQVETDDNKFYGYVDNVDFHGEDLDGVVEQIKKYVNSKPPKAKLSEAQQTHPIELPGRVDEGLWDKAKERVRKEYGYSEDSPRFWKIVTTIYENEGGKFHSQGEKMSESLKKHLMDHYKMSEKEAEDHYGKMRSCMAKRMADENKADEQMKGMKDEELKKLADDVHSEEKTKLADDVHEDEKKLGEGTPYGKEGIGDKKGDGDYTKKEGDELKKMAAAKPKLIELSKKIKTGMASSRLAAREEMIKAKVARLRSAAKMTPAEQKKLNLAELSKATDTELEAFFKGYEIREDVIDTRFHGTTKALSLAKLENLSKGARLARLEAEGRKDLGMPMTDDQRREMETNPYQPPQSAPHEAAVGYDDMMKHLAGLVGEHQAKDAIMAHVKKMMDMKHMSEMPPEHAEHSEKQMSALVKDFNNLQNEFQDLITLVGGFTGIQESELK